MTNVAVMRVFPTAQFKSPTFGVAIHLSGSGMCSNLSALASAYIEVRLPTEWSGIVTDRRHAVALSTLVQSSSATTTITHEDLREFVRRDAVAQVLQPGAKRPPASFVAAKMTPAYTHRAALRQDHPGVAGYDEAQTIADVTEANFRSSVLGLLTPSTMPFEGSVLKEDEECDPDNLPDSPPPPEGWVCQLTGEYVWRYVPGRVLNAKKGDILLSPGDLGLIGRLLRQLSPPQYYSHSGIMTKNHVEIRHSTGSEEWLRDHPRGIAGQPTEGFQPRALIYLWPGTISQTIDEAYYGQWIPSPDTGPYKITRNRVSANGTTITTTAKGTDLAGEAGGRHHRLR